MSPQPSNDKHASDKPAPEKSVSGSFAHGARHGASQGASQTPQAGPRPNGDALLAPLTEGAAPQAVAEFVETVAGRASVLRGGARKATLTIKIHRDEHGAMTAMVGSSVDGKGAEPLSIIELRPAVKGAAG